MTKQVQLKDITNMTASVSNLQRRTNTTKKPSPKSSTTTTSTSSSKSSTTTTSTSSPKSSSNTNKKQAVTPPLGYREENGKKWAIYSLEQVSQHNQDGDLWLAIQGKVYNLSFWIGHHPGGPLSILNLGGKDASDPFFAFHPPYVAQHKLPAFQIGLLDHYQAPPLRKEIERITHELEQDGKFKSSCSFYLIKAVWLMFLFSSVIFCVLSARRSHFNQHSSQLQTNQTSLFNSDFITSSSHGQVFTTIPSSFASSSSSSSSSSSATAATTVSYATWCWVVSAAALLGFFWQQTAFVGHDVGHNAIFNNFHIDNWLSILIHVFFGVSGQWWRNNHNIHHIVPNSVDYDPDIQHLPVFAVTDKIFPGFYSTYYNYQYQLDKFSKWCVSNQHKLYYPVMAIARLNLYAQAMIFLFNKKSHTYNRKAELLAFALFCTWLSLLMSYLPTVSCRVVFFFLSHAVSGTIHVQITLSHFAMPTYMGSGYTNQKQSLDHFIRSQFETTMNISCPRMLEWFHGGLHHQIEHHLFPRLPRHHLHYVQHKYVIPLAKQFNLPYHSFNFFEANKKVLNHLREAADQARRLPTSFSQSSLYQFINAQG